LWGVLTQDWRAQVQPLLDHIGGNKKEAQHTEEAVKGVRSKKTGYVKITK